MPSIPFSLPIWPVCIVALAGCAALPESPTPPDVVRVSVPIRAEPKQRALPEKPRFKVDALPLGAPLRDQARMCFAERDQRRAYETELEAACR